MQGDQNLYRILVADDQSSVIESLKVLLRSRGFEVHTFRSPQVVLESVRVREYDAVLLELNYGFDSASTAAGVELLENIVATDSLLPVIAMSSSATIGLALEAVRRGARDFIQKPWDATNLVETLKRHAQLYRAARQSQTMQTEGRLSSRQNMPSLIATAPAMRHVLDTIAQVGPSNANVLITGEHGTGKEVVAKWLHASSLRKDKPLIAVNTGGLPEGTFESELFGHVKGAFTDANVDRIGRFEMAHGGTLFLDEIANVPLRQQSKLLRVLELGMMERVGSSKTQQVDVRVISATNADLEAECRARNFRVDLLFRLNTVEIKLPPLRERPEDIALLASHFLSKYTARYGKHLQGFAPGATERMRQYEWPGNVRELEHTVERAIIMAREPFIQTSNLALHSAAKSQQEHLGDMTLEEVEAVLISKALARYSGNVRQAAELLGLSRGTFYRRMEKYGLYFPTGHRGVRRQV
jgi:DNA-binding NtrC family response regulator